MLRHARATEASAVRLYREAAHACHGAEALRRLFESIGAQEAIHYEHLTQRLRQGGQHVG
jgi:rubrerythrin